MVADGPGEAFEKVFVRGDASNLSSSMDQVELSPWPMEQELESQCSSLSSDLHFYQMYGLRQSTLTTALSPVCLGTLF